MMAAFGTRFRRIVSLPELAEGCFCFQVLLRLGIERLHLVEFFRRQLWEMANEVDQLPTVQIFVKVIPSPGGHCGKADSMVNDPKYLTVRHRLGVGQS